LVGSFKNLLKKFNSIAEHGVEIDVTGEQFFMSLGCKQPAVAYDKVNEFDFQRAMAYVKAFIAQQQNDEDIYEYAKNDTTSNGEIDEDGQFQITWTAGPEEDKFNNGKQKRKSIKESRGVDLDDANFELSKKMKTQSHHEFTDVIMSNLKDNAGQITSAISSALGGNTNATVTSADKAFYQVHFSFGMFTLYSLISNKICIGSFILKAH
jgi:hypothetical protein